MKDIRVTDEPYEWFKEAIAEMGAMYADEGRGDWADADDTARNRAQRLGDIIGNCEESEEPTVTREADETYRGVTG